MYSKKKYMQSYVQGNFLKKKLNTQKCPPLPPEKKKKNERKSHDHWFISMYSKNKLSVYDQIKVN